MLTAADISFDAIPAQIDERALEAEMAKAGPDEVAQALSAAKAASVSAQHPERLILGSDSLVVVDGMRFDKPDSREQAAEHLRFFSDKEMHLHSAAALVRDGRVMWVGHDIARLSVRTLSDPFINAYLDAEWPEIGHCAGAFRIEGRGVHLFDRIEGDQFAILGMPLLQVIAALREHDHSTSALLK